MLLQMKSLISLIAYNHVMNPEHYSDNGLVHSASMTIPDSVQLQKNEYAHEFIEYDLL